MKATGIVRRIDDLGRVVIPKEIRRTMRIREGDPLLKTLYPVSYTHLPLSFSCTPVCLCRRASASTPNSRSRTI